MNPLPPKPLPFPKDQYLHKPFGFSWFPKETLPPQKSWAATTGDLVYFKQHTQVRAQCTFQLAIAYMY